MKAITTLLLIAISGIGFSQQKSMDDIARRGTLEEVKTLMKDNPDIINTPNEKGFTPLILACYNGNIEVARFLIDHVKDINYRSNEGTALAGLCIRYNSELVEYLLQKKADPNITDTTGTTPLIWAVKMGNEELVTILLKYGAKKEQADEMGITPFEYALKSQKTNIINLLKSD